MKLLVFQLSRRGELFVVDIISIIEHICILLHGLAILDCSCLFLNLLLNQLFDSHLVLGWRFIGLFFIGLFLLNSVKGILDDFALIDLLTLLVGGLSRTCFGQFLFYDMKFLDLFESGIYRTFCLLLFL